MKSKKIARFVKKLDGWRGNAALYQVVPPMEQTAYGLDGTTETTKHGHIVVSGVHHAMAHETMGFPADGEGNVVNMLDLFCTRGTTNHRIALANAGYELVLDPNFVRFPSAGPAIAKPSPAEILEAIRKLLADPPAEAPVAVRHKPVVQRRKRMPNPSYHALRQRRRHAREARNLSDGYCALLIQKRTYQRSGVWVPRSSVSPDAIQAERERLLAKRDER